MLASALRPDNHVRTTQLEMRPRSTIAVAKHIEYGNTASEVLCRRLSVTACHVQHSVQTMRVAGEVQISSRISRLLGNALKLPITLLQLIRFEVSFGSNQT